MQVTPQPSRTSFWNLTLVLLLGVSSLLLAACGGGGGGGGGTLNAGTLDLLLGDAPSDDLASFSATLQEVHLVTALDETDNLLAGSLTIELLGLQQQLAWIAKSTPPAGTYTGLRLVFVPNSYSAIDFTGAAIGITAPSDEWLLSLSPPLVFDDSSYRRLEIDVDLAGSLSGDVGSPPLIFVPGGSVFEKASDDSTSIDEIAGLVLSTNSSAKTLVLSAFADGDATVALGEVTVQVSESTLLEGDDQSIFASSADFFAELQVGQSFLEVHGDLLGGNIEATKIVIEDQSAGSESLSQVKIQGLILNLGADSFELLIQEIEKGESVADGVLSGLGDPSVIQVSFDLSTPVFIDSDVLGDSSMLMVGQEVKVKFADFLSEPFPASQIELEDVGAEFEGYVTDISGLASSMIMTLKSSDPAVQSGAVDSSSTPVTVALGAATLFVDTEGDPEVLAEALLVGQKIEPKGSLSGPSNGPTIAASEVKLFAGRLEGSVSSSTAGVEFTVDDAQIQESFADLVSDGAVTVLLAAGCVFEGDASTALSFHALVTNLGKGDFVVVRVKGLPTGNGNEVLAYEVEAEVESGG